MGSIKSHKYPAKQRGCNKDLVFVENVFSVYSLFIVNSPISLDLIPIFPKKRCFLKCSVQSSDQIKFSVTVKPVRWSTLTFRFVLLTGILSRLCYISSRSSWVRTIVLSSYASHLSFQLPLWFFSLLHHIEFTDEYIMNILSWTSLPQQYCSPHLSFHL